MGLLSVILINWVVAYAKSGNRDSVLDLFPEFANLSNRASVLESSVAANTGQLSNHQNRLARIESYKKAYFYGVRFGNDNRIVINTHSVLGLNKIVSEPSWSFSYNQYTIPYSGVYVFSLTISTFADGSPGFSSEIVVDDHIRVVTEARHWKISTTESFVYYVRSGYKAYVRQHDGCCNVLRKATFSIYRIA